MLVLVLVEAKSKVSKNHPSELGPMSLISHVNAFVRISNSSQFQFISLSNLYLNDSLPVSTDGWRWTIEHQAKLLRKDFKVQTFVWSRPFSRLRSFFPLTQYFRVSFFPAASLSFDYVYAIRRGRRAAG